MILPQPTAKRPDFVQILVQVLIITGITLLSLGVFSFLALYAGGLVAGMSSMEFAKAVQSGQPPLAVINGMKVFQVLAVTGLFLVPGLVLPRILFNRNPIAYTGLDRHSAFILYLLPALAILAFSPLVDGMSLLNQQMQLPESLNWLQKSMRDLEDTAGKTTESFLQMSGPMDLVVNLFVIAFMAALTEEVFFRGMLQRVVYYWTDRRHLSIWITAFVFSFIHFQFFGFLPRFALGLLLGYAFMWTGNLKVSILMHFLNNGAQVLAVYLSQKGIIKMNADLNQPGTQPVINYILSALLTGLFLYLTWRRARRIKLPNAMEAALSLQPQDSTVWVKVYSTGQSLKADIVAGNLRNAGIEAVVVNRQSSSYQLGEVEVRVPEEDAEKALDLIPSYDI